MYSFEVKIRQTVYLWGSSQISTNLQWPLLLILRNDLFGEPISIATHVSGGESKQLGTLNPGECYTISLLGLSGVSAACPSDSNVTCVLDSPQSAGPA